MKVLLFFGILLLAIHAPADNTNQDDSFLNLTHDEMYQPRLVGERVPFEYVGNPDQLHLRSWFPGEIMLVDGQTRKVSALRYNAFRDELVWLSDNDQLVRIEKNRIEGFRIFNSLSGDTLHFEKLQVRVPLRREPITIFAEVLRDGDVSVYVYRNIKSGGREVIRDGNTAFERRVYADDYVYYLVFPDNEMVSFRNLRRNSLLRAFPDNRREIRQALRQHFFSFRFSEEALVRTIDVLEPVLLEAMENRE
jgi:hypothetical protein